MSGQTTAGQAPATERKRRRTVNDGRIVTNVPECFGKYIAEQADSLGVSPSTMARMLIVEAIKGRGHTKDSLEAEQRVGSNIVPPKEISEPVAV